LGYADAWMGRVFIYPLDEEAGNYARNMEFLSLYPVVYAGNLVAFLLANVPKADEEQIGPWGARSDRCACPEGRRGDTAPAHRPRSGDALPAAILEGLVSHAGHTHLIIRRTELAPISGSFVSAPMRERLHPY
jgi:hypothetical protein